MGFWASAVIITIITIITIIIIITQCWYANDNVPYPDPVLAYFPTINEVQVKVVFHPSRYKEKYAQPPVWPSVFRNRRHTLVLYRTPYQEL